MSVLSRSKRLLNAVHGALIFRRRVEALADRLAIAIPSDAIAASVAVSTATHPEGASGAAAARAALIASATDSNSIPEPVGWSGISVLVHLVAPPPSSRRSAHPRRTVGRPEANDARPRPGREMGPEAASTPRTPRRTPPVRRPGV